MRVKIQAEGYNFTIPLPLGIILNGFTIRIVKSCLKYTDINLADVSISEEQLHILIRELKRAKKVFPNLPLVDIKTGNKQRVLITL